MQRVRRIESAAGFVSIRGARRVRREEAEAAFARLSEALRVDFIALAGDVPSPVGLGDVEDDIETLMAWSSQRGATFIDNSLDQLQDDDSGGVRVEGLEPV